MRQYYRKINKEGRHKHEFDGNLEWFLLDIGVDEKHIRVMKNKELVSQEEYRAVYCESDEERVGLVPLKKVVGTSRGTVGISVYDNVRTMYDGEREPRRFECCFGFLERMSLDELKKSYEHLKYPVNMIYYEEDDVYFLTIDGNHRTLTAMLLGAEYIKAKIRVAHCDYVKKEKYIATKIFFNKYHILKIEDPLYCGCDITFKNNEECFTVSGFSQVEQRESCYDVIEKLTNEIEYDIQYLKKINRLPCFLGKVALYFSKNKRLSQYKYRRYDPKHRYRIVNLWEL